MEEKSLLQSLRQVVHDPRTDYIAHIIAVVFLVFSLWLPPASAGVRVLHLDYPVITSIGGAISTADGAQLLVPKGALARQLRLKMTAISRSDFLSGLGDKVIDAAAKALSLEPVVPKGDYIYRFSKYGPTPAEAVLTLPLPKGMDPHDVDLYTWDGKAWVWTPAHVIAEDGVLEAQLTSIPSIAAVVQMERLNPMVAAVVEDQTTVADEVASVLSSESKVSNEARGVLLAEAEVPGKPTNSLSEINPDGFNVNADGTVSDVQSAAWISVPQGYFVLPVVSNRQNGKVQSQVLEDILLDSELRTKNIAAITELAVSKGYAGVQLDYQGLAPGLRDEFVSFVTELADSLHAQGKLLAVRVAEPEQIAEDRWDTGAYDWQALGKVVDTLIIPALDSPSAYAPGGQMEALLRWAVGEVNRTKLQIAISAYSYKIVAGALTRIPYLRALSEVCQLAVENGKEVVGPGEDITLVLPRLCESVGLQYDEDTATYWIGYKDGQGRDTQIWLENADSIAHKLQLVANYNIRGLVLENLFDAQNDERILDLLKHFRSLFIPPMHSEFTVVWMMQEEASNKETTVAISPLSTPICVLKAPDEPGDYKIVAAISDDGGQTTAVRSAGLDVEVPTPTPTPTPKPTPKPKPKAAAPSRATRGPGFDYGIQGDAITDTNYGRLFGLVQQLGFRWYKQQVEWFRYNPGPGQYDWGALDRIVDSANAAGIKLLFSVVKAPKWARPPGDTDQGPPADPGTYAAFLREMAARYKGRVHAYEIWNEQNLYYEWGGRGGKLNAGRYVELLKAAYQAIKSVDTNETVMSGALTPTGWNDGDIAIDDRVYLEQMYQAGLKNYCDAIGAHPSGYNNPPDADWRTFQDPSASFQAKGHPSWFFRATMESYRNIMLKYGDGRKRIWPTEFGWASVEGLGVAPAPGYEYAADNTEQEQAQYIVRAYEMARNWGWVGPMFLWNLNFAPVCGAGDEKAAFSIVRPDWSPRLAFAALANMPK